MRKRVSLFLFRSLTSADSVRKSVHTQPLVSSVETTEFLSGIFLDVVDKVAEDTCPDFMKANIETKRLFVGGLSQAISKTDLQNQFSRFGEVSDVEIITRKDEQGNSQKAFAYVNIKIAETDLKKCMSILNKTKWKGGTLQIQLAKESFLHRLAQEREEAKAKKEMSTTGNTTLLEKVEGVDFHMKAVPGTEVPGHKDGRPEDKTTHIIFASDSETEMEEISIEEQSFPREELVKQESMNKTSGKLFDSSDEEESDSKDDSNRFNIKPQYEGKAGQKLMDLQLHFGSDERFRMDSRFLESDSEEEQEVNENETTEEEELAAERNRTLDIVQTVLNLSFNSYISKETVSAKKFKDIIRYDPTRDDHATYERKQDDKAKESKAKRKKKREEAEKLPEVSKEMYYNIATDLKEIFQTAKDTCEEEEKEEEKKDNVPQKENCDQEETGEINAAVLPSGAKQTSGFTFSFFDSDTKDIKKDTYKVEAVKHGKIVYHGDPCFQDSSSEEEDVPEEADHKKPSPGEEAFPGKEPTRFFFFSKNDGRLHGSDLFWSGVGSNVSKHSWEARTNSLLLDCRKKHREAKRKMKPN